MSNEDYYYYLKLKQKCLNKFIIGKKRIKFLASSLTYNFQINNIKFLFISKAITDENIYLKWNLSKIHII